MDSKYFLCSECFKDIGLKTEAKKVSIKDNSVCIHCGKKTGNKLNKKLLDVLCHNFFVINSSYKHTYGGSYYINYNKAHYGTDDNIMFTKSLEDDVKIFQKYLKIGFFFYGPRLCYLGENKYLRQFSKHGNSNEYNNAIKKLIENSKIKYYTPKNIFYRLRKNPQNPTLNTEYDSAPSGKGRYNQNGMRLLYASKDIQTCIQECRIIDSDKLYIATLKPTKRLKLLDLTNISHTDNVDLFENINFAVRLLLNANDISYKECYKIAKRIKSYGFDGFLSNSHFKPYLNNKSINVSLFNFPIKENKIKVISINRLLLNKINYKFSFGPSIE